LKVPARQDKHANPSFDENSQSGLAIPNAVVLRDHDPPSFTNDSQPIFIQGILIEVIVVNPHVDPGFTERGSYFPLP
jgi:hypothetical protein